ncbi:alpha/beta hydrolase [Sphingomonas sp. C8-2]|jgi:pimeloyl-ACP methyl ester carboxylesterase|nr:alpha/beta hydrolase [Sphingomonas sp. C8-2]
MTNSGAASTMSTIAIAQGTVVSTDGTVLAYQRLGSGAPLVVCHGSFSVAGDWRRFGEAMATKRTVYLYDRRGRGLSQLAASEFALDAEVDDLAAIMALAGPGAALLGHSFGGGCALSFAQRESFTGPLILYEPRHSTRVPVSRGHIPELQRLIDAGDPDAAMAFALTHVVGLPSEAVAGMRQSPMWKALSRTIGAFPKELRLLDSLAWRPGDLDTIAGPVSLLIGEQSPVLPDAVSPDVALQELLPGLRKRVIPGEGHLAYASSPALLADIVCCCLTGGED